MIRSCQERRNPLVDNTSIGLVATNAILTKAQAAKLASMSHHGFARTMRLAYTMFDGDTIFAMATGHFEADLSILGLQTGPDAAFILPQLSAT